ncbi:MAG: hypothetical protein COA79_05210 [Planctomycetota bacterium]|nr:MAG: hypothetical protein COA79_05210 [Planctomycetota bacterium]
MKLYCNNSDQLPHELKELFQINGYFVENYDPKTILLEDFLKSFNTEENEIYLFLCYIDYISYTDIGQFPFLHERATLPENIKFIPLLNDFEEKSSQMYEIRNAADTHFLSDPHFALIQKLKLQESNFKNFKIWGSKVLIIDQDISNLKLMNMIFTQQNHLSICCSNVYELKRYLNRQVKLIILSDKFAINDKFNSILKHADYHRNKICIVNQGSRSLIKLIKDKGYFIIFERPIKLENLLKQAAQNLSTTATIMRKQFNDINSFSWPIESFIAENQENITSSLKTSEDYYLVKNEINAPEDKVIVFQKDKIISFENLKNLLNKSEDSKLNTTINNKTQSTTHINIKKDQDFYDYIQKRLSWLFDDLFVYVSKLEFFPEIYPDLWFPYFQKDLKAAIKTPAVLIQFFTFDLHGHRDYIDQVLNTCILSSLMLTKSIPDKYGEWPVELSDYWSSIEEDHKMLVKLALSTRIDLFQYLSNLYNPNLDLLLELNQKESNILFNFTWVSPFEETFESIHIARILQLVSTFMGYITGVHTQNYLDEPLTIKKTCFKLLYDANPPLYRLQDLFDFLSLLKMWSLWNYHLALEKVKTFPCMLTKELYNGYHPIKIECANPQKALDYQHSEFCNGCHAPCYDPNFDKKISYCQTANEKIKDLAIEIFGSMADLSEIFEEDLRRTKKSGLL